MKLFISCAHRNKTVSKSKLAYELRMIEGLRNRAKKKGSEKEAGEGEQNRTE